MSSPDVEKAKEALMPARGECMHQCVFWGVFVCILNNVKPSRTSVKFVSLLADTASQASSDEEDGHDGPVAVVSGGKQTNR